MPFNWTTLIPIGFLAVILLYWFFCTIASLRVRIQNWDEVLPFLGLILIIIVGLIVTLAAPTN